VHGRNAGFVFSELIGILKTHTKIYYIIRGEKVRILSEVRDSPQSNKVQTGTKAALEF
jgi:hypothetical protein